VFQISPRTINKVIRLNKSVSVPVRFSMPAIKVLTTGIRATTNTTSITI
jgi:hypothetical protein